MYSVQLECPAGYHGEQCLKTCHCQNGATCDPQTGVCICPSGLTGNVCQESE